MSFSLSLLSFCFEVKVSMACDGRGIPFNLWLKLCGVLRFEDRVVSWFSHNFMTYQITPFSYHLRPQKQNCQVTYNCCRHHLSGITVLIYEKCDLRPHYSLKVDHLFLFQTVCWRHEDSCSSRFFSSPGIALVVLGTWGWHVGDVSVGALACGTESFLTCTSCIRGNIQVDINRCRLWSKRSSLSSVFVARISKLHTHKS